MGKLAADDPMIAAAAKASGLPLWVVQATIEVQSDFEVQAFVPATDRLDTGRGLMLLSERMIRGIGYAGLTGDDRSRTGGMYDPEVNLELGCQILATKHTLYPTARWEAVYMLFCRGQVECDPSGRPVEEPKLDRWRQTAQRYLLSEDLRARKGGKGNGG